MNVDLNACASMFLGKRAFQSNAIQLVLNRSQTRLEQESEMKHSLVFLTFSACLLIPAAALAANPHPVTTSKTGQPGTNNGITCNMSPAGIAAAPGNPSANGSAANAMNSPFGASPPPYAGNPGNPTGPGGAVTPPSHNPIASQYDVSCFQAP